MDNVDNEKRIKVKKFYPAMSKIPRSAAFKKNALAALYALFSLSNTTFDYISSCDILRCEVASIQFFTTQTSLPISYASFILSGCLRISPGSWTPKPRITPANFAHL